MKIIGAGFGRTGTKSLQVALEQLGFGPCYHMTEVFTHPDHVRTWQYAALGKQVDWRSFLKDYQATVDFPGCTFYKPLMEVYPDAKVLLSVRDPERWYDSCLQTIYAISQTFPMSLVGPYMPRLGPIYRMVNQSIWKGGLFQGRFRDRAFAIEQFNRHNEEVKRTVPPERLLVYDVKEGWGPLCHFLGVPVPEGVPFPHLNDTREFRQRVLVSRIVSSAVLLAVAGGVVGALWALWPRRKQGAE